MRATSSQQEGVHLPAQIEVDAVVINARCAHREVGR